MTDPISEARIAAIEASSHAGIICYRLRNKRTWFDSDKSEAQREMFLLRVNEVKKAVKRIEQELPDGQPVKYGNIAGKSAHHVALRLCDLILFAISRDLKDGETVERLRNFGQNDCEELIAGINLESEAMRNDGQQWLTLQQVALGFGWLTGEDHRPYSVKVGRLADSGELRDNGQSGKPRLKSQSSGAISHARL